MRFIFLVFILSSIFSYAKVIKPTLILESKGLVNDFVFDGSKIYVANDEGSVEIFDLHSQKKIDEIFINPMFSAKQEWKNVKILSVDRLNGKTLIVSTNKNAFRDVWLHDGQNLKHIIKAKDKLPVKEARFIDEDKFLFGTLSYEMVLYNTNDSYSSYTKQMEQSAFSDLELSSDKNTMITSSESGQITISDVKTGKIIAQPKPLNLDNVYQVAYQNGTILTGGQDRRIGVYPKDDKPYYIKSDFLVYSVALSPDAKLGVYSSDEENNLQVFKIASGEKTHTLKGHFAIPTKIKFYDQVGLFSAGYENKIFYWRLQ